MSKSVEKVSVSLSKYDRNIVDNLARRKGLGARGFSAALRMIIREWLELRNGSENEHERQEEE